MVIFLKKFIIYLIIFILGGFGYGSLEIGFRGYTHWSMIITGGSAFLCLYIINETFENAQIYQKALLGAFVITILELTVGLVVNKMFSLAVWDYTNTPFNLLGIISLPFSFCWYVISYISFIIFKIIKRITAQLILYIPLHRGIQLQRK